MSTIAELKSKYLQLDAEFIALADTASILLIDPSSTAEQRAEADAAAKIAAGHVLHAGHAYRAARDAK